MDAEENQNAMEFNGCWYHRHPRCYPNDRESLQVIGKTLQQRYVEMLKKKRKHCKNWDLYFMKCGIAITNYTTYQTI